jgi:hypothetical protein
MEWWFIDHAAGVSGAIFATAVAIAWWRWRRHRQPAAPDALAPMSAQWRQSKDRYRGEIRHARRPTRSGMLDGGWPDGADERATAL